MCIAAVAIYFTNIHILDPICTLVFCVIVFTTTIGVLIDCIKIIMEATPDRLDIKSLS